MLCGLGLDAGFEISGPENLRRRIMRHAVHRAFVAGDTNCDQRANNFDVDSFIVALTDPAAYTQAHPMCSHLKGDVKVDGMVHNLDLDLPHTLLNPGCNLIERGPFFNEFTLNKA